MGKLPRLLSHHLVGGALVVVAFLAVPDWAAFVAAVCYVHVLADLVADVVELARAGRIY